MHRALRARCRGYTLHPTKVEYHAHHRRECDENNGMQILGRLDPISQDQNNSGQRNGRPVDQTCPLSTPKWLIIPLSELSVWMLVITSRMIVIPAAPISPVDAGLRP